MRPRWIALAGVVLLAACIGVFVWYGVRDDQLRLHGAQTTASVVRTIPAAGWNFADSGRVVVRYNTPRGSFTRAIWLDDAANAPKSTTWPVIYDRHSPGRVRSLTDANDPAPLFPFLLLSGLVGLGLLVWQAIAALVRRSNRVWIRSADRPDGSRGTLVQLRYLHFFSRRPFIEVDGGEVRFRLPGTFGRTPFIVPVSQVVVVRAGDGAPADDPGEGWVFTRAPLIPFIRTGSGLGASNLTLFFRQPQRVPPVRRMRAQLPSRQSRTDEGVLLDGISLRASDPLSGIGVLAGAGCASTDRPNAWLREHHETSSDPLEIQRVRRNGRHRRWAATSALVGVIGIQAVRFTHPPLPWVWVALGIGAVLVFGGPLWAKRRDGSD